MLVEKYQPKTLDEIIGQRDFIKKFEEWLDDWKPGEALLIYGSTGTGKSLISKLVAEKRNLNVFEVTASDNRSASSLKEKLMPATKERSLLKGRLILIDDIDTMGLSDKGGVAEIIKILKESAFPVILTAKNAYDQKLRTLRLFCKLLKINKIRKDLIENEITKIAEKEKPNIDYKTIKTIAENADGDIRSAINDLEIASQLDSVGYREREVDIFETLRTIFKSQDLGEVKKSIRECEKDVEEIFWWVEQNTPKEYENPEEIAAAFDFLSKADLFRNKALKTNNFRFKEYMLSMIAAVSVAKKMPYRKFVPYMPPDRLILLGRTKEVRKNMKEFYLEMGQRLHCSTRKVKEQMPFLNIILNQGDLNSVKV